MARVRTEEKRAEIVRIASEAFDELGYDRCSMATISDRLGGSKATLYGYFSSKEELLRAVLQCNVTTEFYEIVHELNEDPDLRAALIRLGKAYLKKKLSSLPVANIRCIMNQPPCSTMGKEFYGSVIRPMLEGIANHLKEMMDRGRLRQADPWVALMHWKGLHDWDMFERRLIGVITGPEDVDIERVATLGADAFLKLYGVEEGAKKESAPVGNA